MTQPFGDFDALARNFKGLVGKAAQPQRACITDQGPNLMIISEKCTRSHRLSSRA